jgi:cell division protein FtsL
MLASKLMKTFPSPKTTGKNATGCPTRNRQRGAGRIKAIIWTLILASFIYVSVKVVPILFNEYQFQDGIQTIARYASANRQSLEQINQAVLKEAEKDDLPIGANDIKVEAASGNVHISADYSVTVDLKVYQWTLNFHPAVVNNALY